MKFIPQQRLGNFYNIFSMRLKMRVFSHFFFVIILSSIISAQVVTWEPVYFTENDSVTIYFDATKGTGGLEGYSGDVYAHMGLITSRSADATAWYYVLGTQWGDNTAKTKMTRIDTDLYKITIAPSVLDYYVTSEGLSLQSGEEILELAFVFRSSNSSLEGKDVGGTDIFIPLKTGVNIISPADQPLFVDLNDTINIVAVGSDALDEMKLYIDNILFASTTEDTLRFDHTAVSYGQTWVRVVGEQNSSFFAADSFYYIVNQSSNVAGLPPGVVDGINYIDNNTVTLVLYAPNKEFVYAVGDFSNWAIDPAYQMNVTPLGERYWITLTGLTAGEEYAFQYYVNGILPIPDPYTDKILDPWNDEYIDNDTYPNLKNYPAAAENIVSVFQTAQEEYQWQVTDFQKPDKENLVIYELLIRDFVSTHQYQTLIDTLDYFVNLGINAIELMPVSEFEGNESWGYNPMMYFAPDKYYGTKNDLKAFIDAAHEKGIAVIMDIVLNHAYGLNPMVRLYFEGGAPSAENPWFNITSPNTAFSWGYDFNHESLATQDFVDRVNNYWLDEYKFDGFRFDFTKGFTNTPGDGGAYDAARINILKRMADKIWENHSDAYVILEHFAEDSEEEVLTDYGMMVWGNLNHNYLEASMGYSASLSRISYFNHGFNLPNLVGYMESHDEERMMYKNQQFGNSSDNYNITELSTALDRAKLAAAFFFTVPGPKMIWQFGELGYDYSIDYNGRVGNKPIRWDYYNDPDRHKLLKTYSALIELKNNYEVFSTDDFTIYGSLSAKRINLNHASMNVTIVGNFGTVVRSVGPNFQNTGTWYDYFSGDSIEVNDTQAAFDMNPGEFHIYTSVKLPTPEEGLITGIENDSELASEYNLAQNYPNPFNPTTTITYTLAEGTFVSLKIYNLLGQEVKMLVSGAQTPGVHKIEWDGTGKSGNSLASGIYFYQLKADDFNQIKKMIMLK